MLHRVVSTVAAMLAATAVLSNAMAADRQLNGWAAAKATSPAALSEALDKASRVRVTVELTEPQQSTAGIASATESIAGIQSDVLSAVFSDIGIMAEGEDSPRGLRRMRSIPAFSVTIDQAELERLASDPRVRSISAERELKPHVDQSTRLIGMAAAWGGPYGARGNGQAVAILDTGVNLGHDFLGSSRIMAQACFSGAGSALQSICPNGKTTQTSGNAARACSVAISSGCMHGTHVAGIAAGFNSDRDADEPKRGVAFRSKIVPVQVFSSGLSAYDSDILAALDWIYANRETFPSPVAAINLSLGTFATYPRACDRLNPPMTRMIRKLREAGIATIISAGNGGEVNRVAYPGCISAAITVGATTKSANRQPERIAYYSNMGRTVDLLAPGGDIEYPAGLDVPSMILSSVGKDRFQDFQGTSMAAPHVAGAFAAMRSASGCGRRSVDALEQALAGSGKLIKDHRPRARLAGRRIAVDEALDKLGCTRSSAVRVSSAGSWMRQPGF